ncbi:MAG TPA: hypothetical protein EYP17_07830 [Candidatus Latescibacteria bacterium]|nr:hypothetical protein [Candidatus Latescibacterota bacterium]
MRILVRAGMHNRRDCPVSVRTGSRPEGRHPVLVEEETRRAIPAQVEPEGEEILLWWVLDNLPAGAERAYTLEWREEPLSEGVQLVQREGQVEVVVLGQAFTTYHCGPEWVRPFLYPLIGPYGLSMTRRLARSEDKDMDHHHHRSFWVAHGDVNGVDNWSEMEGHGRTLHREFLRLDGGPVFGRIVAVGDWVSVEGRKVLEEVRDLRIYALPDRCRLVDMDVELKAAEGDATFGDTKEGGIASLRVQPSMEVRNGGRIENSYGAIGEKEAWGKRASWCDYSGPVEGRWVGMALMDHPEGFRYPTYWHVRDYGLMTANPFGLSHFYNDPNRRGDHILRAGESIKFRYRLYVHVGDAREGQVAEKYHDFVNPPEVLSG